MSSPRIAVLVATAPGFNPGMMVTELALAIFLRRHGWMGRTSVFRLRETSESSFASDAFETQHEDVFEYLSGREHYDSIVSSSLILLWADFLHMAQYLREREVILAENLKSDAGSTDAGIAVRKLFLLADANDSVLRRTISFGTTLLFNTIPDEADPSYGVPLRRLFGSARRIWVRDALSAARVAHLRDDYATGYFGIDCALLLRREDVLAEGDSLEPTDAALSKDVLVFFGRDPTLRDGLNHVATELARHFERSLRWVPWGDRGAFPRLQSAPDSASFVNGSTIQALLREVANASLIVTDTYHLALIAWNFGVPAVCAFSAYSTDPNDVSSGAAFNWRDKREVFFSQYDALDFLIRPDELYDGDRSGRRWDHLVRSIGDRDLCASVTAKMRAHATRIEADLVSEMQATLRTASAM